MRPKPSSTTPAELRAWRKAHGWTQVQLAEELGVSRRLVQYYEAGKVRIPLIVGKVDQPVARSRRAPIKQKFLCEQKENEMTLNELRTAYEKADAKATELVERCCSAAEKALWVGALGPAAAEETATAVELSEVAAETAKMAQAVSSAAFVAYMRAALGESTPPPATVP